MVDGLISAATAGKRFRLARQFELDSQHSDAQRLP
jgi:hypothetical protein